MNTDINIYPAEEIIKEKLSVDPTADVFPITLVKFLLNQDKILNFFQKIETEDIHNNPAYIDIDSSKCDACINNQRKMLCRKHTSIKRVLDTHKICYDEDTGIYLYMNEMFKFFDDKLAIIYAPHTKLIQGQITNYKVKKVSPLVTTLDIEPNFQLRDVHAFQSKSSDISDLYIKCWFNDEFSLVTNPDSIDGISFCLVPNK